MRSRRRGAVKNKEGYPDPTAGKALANVRRREKQEQKKKKPKERSEKKDVL